MLDGMLAKAHRKDLPSLAVTYQRLLDEQVRRDMLKEGLVIPTGDTHGGAEGAER
jgi:hypothetical protein